MKKVLLVAAILITGGYLQADLASLGQKVKAAVKDITDTGKPTSETLGAGAEIAKEARALVGKAKVYPTDTKTSFEMKNKSTQPVSFKVKSDDTFVKENEAELFTVPSGKTKGLSVDIERMSEIDVWTTGDPKTDNPAMKFSLPKGKTAYLTWDGSTLRPQTGPAMGKLGRTDTGLSLSKNVTKDDVKKA